MTDEAALIAAICDDPDSDTPRLVYADWLDEHNGEKLAKLIRVQIDIAQAPQQCRSLLAKPRKLKGGGISRFCGECDLCHFRTSDLQLWRELGISMVRRLGLLPGKYVPSEFVRSITGPDDFAMSYTRGFADTLTCIAAVWFELADSIYWHPKQGKKCRGCDNCRNWGKPAFCDGTGHIPRPFPLTAQPLRKVIFTHWATPRFEEQTAGTNGPLKLRGREQWVPFEKLQHNRPPELNLLEIEWPGLEFVLPPERIQGIWPWHQDGLPREV